MQDAAPLYLRTAAGDRNARVGPMTRPLDPEMKAHRAILRALIDLPFDVQARILRYWVERGGILRPPAPSEKVIE